MRVFLLVLALHERGRDMHHVGRLLRLGDRRELGWVRQGIRERRG
jgi:hypothetical protein